MDESDLRRVIAALDEVKAEQNVTILFAVESGSRAWGHPSPDSDFDVRFIYARPLAAYLTIGRRRDVIECPPMGDLDLAGWDIDKALRLLVRGNPAILEWLASPILYRADETFRQRLDELAAATPFRRSGFWHYRALARRQRELLGSGEEVRLKRYFYVLRPALALRWARVNEGIIPMDLPTLLGGLDLSVELRSAIGDLLARKAASAEMGRGKRIPVLDSFISEELDASPAELPPGREPAAAVIEQADELLRDVLLDRLRPG
jgi:predicted nucleotidyltransferase